MKTFIAFALSLATPAITYISLTQDYTLEAIYTGMAPEPAIGKQALHGQTAVEDAPEDKVKAPYPLKS
ncbi:MAG: hypothetical protein ACU841_06155 [Gammaproteobacteria bacterium]